MIFSRRAATLAASTFVVALSACGGSDSSAGPTPLPASVAIEAVAQAETAAPVDFHTNIATPPAGLVFHWDFGDGTSADGPTAQHAFGSGDYTVALTLSNGSGATRHATAPLSVRFFSNVAGLNCTGPSFGGWCWQDVLVTGHDFGAVNFIDATHGWAVGNHGAIAVTADGGGTWALQASPSVDNLGSVRFADALHGWAMGPIKGLQTVDGGQTWTANAIGDAQHWDYDPVIGSADPTSVAITDFVGADTTVSHDNGATWARTSLRVYNGVTMSPNGDCWTETNLVVYRAAGCSGAVTSAALPHPADFSGFTSQVFVADATHARITAFGFSSAAGTFTMLGWETADGGATWATFTPTRSAGKVFSQQMYGDAGWAQPTGGGTTLLHTTDGGHSWTTLAPPLDCIDFCTVFSGSFDGSNAWITSGREIALTHDAGTTWQQVLIPVEYGRFGGAVLLASADGRTLLVDVNGRILQSRDGGVTWTRTLGRDPVDGLGSAAAIHFASGRTGIALSAAGILRTTADGGHTWTHRYLPVTLADWPVDVHLDDEHHGWVLFQGALQSTTDAGASLGAPIVPPGAARLRGMAWGDALHGAVTDESAVAWITADGGATWVRVDGLSAIGSGHVSDLVLETPVNAVARLDDGTAATSADGGVTWTRATSPPTAGYGYPLRATTGGGTWLLGSTPQRSLDHGRTWQAVAMAGVAQVLDVAFADPSHGWVLADGGQVLRTEDGGTTWTTLVIGADISLARLAVADRKTAWIATLKGPLLSTASGGR